MKKRMIIAIIALIFVFGGIFGWKAIQGYFIGQYFANFQPPPVTVSVGEAQLKSWQPRIRAVGTLAAVNGVDVTAEVAGSVREIGFESGAIVKKGDPLIQLDDSIEQAQLPGANASLRLASQNLERTRSLVERKLAAPEDLDQSQSQYDQARSTVAALQATIAKKAVRAPFSGTLDIRLVNLGQYLQAGAPVVGLQSLNPLYVDFALPEQYINRVKHGQQVELNISAWPDERFDGSITAISSKVDTRTHNFRVQATLPNADNKLRPGLFADINVVAGEPEEHVTIPRNAINYTLYGDSVYVVSESAQQHTGAQQANEKALIATQRFVRLGEERNSDVVVLEGIAAGERIVTAGQLKLNDGSRVKIDNSVELD